jgi:hypothetical protein
MTVLSADILDRDFAGAETLRACLRADHRYVRLCTLARRRQPVHRPFPQGAPRGATLHVAAATLVLASAGAAAVAWPGGLLSG